MRESILLGKLKIKSGESSLLIVFLLTGILIFIFLPIVSSIFERSMVRLAVQEITDQIDLSTYQIYQHIDLNSLSRLDLEVDSEMLNSINNTLHLNHPQIASLLLLNISLIKGDITQMSFEIELVMNPTLYRTFYNLNKRHVYNYKVQLPIDGEKK